MTARNLLAFALCGALLACSSPPQKTRGAAERGKRLFETKALSTSSLNDFTCANCHDTERNELSKSSGAPLAGATLRSLFWGGQEDDLLRSINACRDYFMLASTPLSAEDQDARDLYAYLESLEPGDATDQPFTVVTTIDAEGLPRGDELSGQTLYVQACASCHGAMHTGEGRLSDRVPVLPEDTIAVHPSPTYSARSQRLVFIEKIRHGLFLGYSGTMPPLSTEVLSNSEVSDVLEALGVLGDTATP